VLHSGAQFLWITLWKSHGTSKAKPRATRVSRRCTRKRQRAQKAPERNRPANKQLPRPHSGPAYWHESNHVFALRGLAILREDGLRPCFVPTHSAATCGLISAGLTSTSFDCCAMGAPSMRQTDVTGGSATECIAVDNFSCCS
jgi:hypothetical protein